MSKYKHLILILVVIIFIVLLIDFSMFFYLKNKNNSNNNSFEMKETLENNNQEIELIKYRSFNCTTEKRVLDNYTIDYFYYFIFKNNDLDSGYLNYVYTFNNLENYNAFKFSSSPSPVKEDFNVEKKTKTYTMAFYFPQEEKGDNAVEKYIEQLNKQDYVCEENVYNIYNEF